LLPLFKTELLVLRNIVAATKLRGKIMKPKQFVASFWFGSRVADEEELSHSEAALLLYQRVSKLLERATGIEPVTSSLGILYRI